MKLIIGLGNPGQEYASTRHNIGFEIADKFKEANGFPEFEMNGKFNAEISKKDEAILVKPQTFMNLSGDAVRAILDFYKASPDDIIVIHDDLDIALGKFKIATDSSSAGHNGVQDIIDKLGTQKFKRIRIGIGEEKDGAITCRLGAHDFVLQKFTDEENKKIADILPAILDESKNFISC